MFESLKIITLKLKFLQILFFSTFELWFLTLSHAQIYTKPTQGVEVKYHYAILLAHHAHMRILTDRHFPMIQVNFFNAGNYHREWQQLYDYPMFGISLLSSPLSSQQYLGSGIGVAPFVNYPLFRTSLFSVNFFVSSGIGYIGKPFDMRNNYKNQAIGSHLNALLAGQIDLRYRINESSEVSTGISLTHFSNGKVKVPNLGINNVGFFVGYAHHFTTNEPAVKEVHSTEDPAWEKNVFLAAAIKQIYPVGGNYYPYTALSFNVKKIINRKRKIGVGADIFYDFSDRARFVKMGVMNPDITYTKPALYALHDFRMGKTSVFVHIGAYLYAYEKNQGYGMIYDRAGIQYYFNNSISALVALKTHYAKADCIEWAINFSF